MLPKIIPDKLPGTVQPQYIRCGKPNCKCAHGELHGPYWYPFWRERSGRQHKEYIRKVHLDAVIAACEAAAKERTEIHRILSLGAQAVRWLQGQALEPEDAMDAVLFYGQMYRAFSELVELACGDRGEPRDSIKAFGILAPIDRQVFGFQA